MAEHSHIVAAEQPLSRALRRIEDRSARKTVIMSKWERGELDAGHAMHLIRSHGLEAY